jgi:hypothetical protein
LNGGQKFLIGNDGKISWIKRHTRILPHATLNKNSVG